jgi:hypothetical protein
MMRLLIHAGSGVPRIVCEIDGFTMNYLGHFRKKQGLQKCAVFKGSFSARHEVLYRKYEVEMPNEFIC